MEFLCTMSIFSRESRYNCIVCMKILNDGTAVKNFVANYRKVASSRLSRLVAHFELFRRLMKGIFDAYVL